MFHNILSEMAASHLAVVLMKGFLHFNYKNILTNASLAYYAAFKIQFNVIYEGVN